MGAGLFALHKNRQWAWTPAGGFFLAGTIGDPSQKGTRALRSQTTLRVL